MLEELKKFLKRIFRPGKKVKRKLSSRKAVPSSAKKNLKGKTKKKITAKKVALPEKGNTKKKGVAKRPTVLKKKKIIFKKSSAKKKAIPKKQAVSASKKNIKKKEDASRGTKKKIAPKILKKTTKKIVLPVSKKSKEQDDGILVGEITHYFSKIQVVVLKITQGKIAIGDSILLKGKKNNFKQKVKSLQVESLDVKSAKKGQLVGLHVDKKTDVGDQVFKL